MVKPVPGGLVAETTLQHFANRMQPTAGELVQASYPLLQKLELVLEGDVHTKNIEVIFEVPASGSTCNPEKVTAKYELRKRCLRVAVGGAGRATSYV